MTFDSNPDTGRKLRIFEFSPTNRSTPVESAKARQQASDAPKPGLPIVPVIRTQQPSPTEVVPSRATKRRSATLDSAAAKDRHWADFATYMRNQREKGFSEIRTQRIVQFKDQNPSESGRSSPLPPPVRPSDGSRPNSPANRSPSSRRYVEEDDWAPRPRPSPRNFAPETFERGHVPLPQKKRSSPSIATNGIHELPPRRKLHEVPSPLSFGARGPNIKPSQLGQQPPLVPIKDEKGKR